MKQNLYEPANVYAYDTLDRVTKADYHDSENEQFVYDKLGNRLTLNNRADNDIVYAHNNVNEYTNIGGTAPLYDAAGNLTKDINGYTYYYDYDNRLTAVKKNSDSTFVATYTYDALGRRVQAEDSIAGVKTRYYYDGQRVLLESDYLNDENQTDERYFIYGNYIDEVLVMVDDLGGTPDDLYYGHDHLYSPVILFASDGTTLERYEYDVYGKLNRLNPDFSNWSGTPAGNPYYFTGRRLDEFDTNGDFKIMYYRARYYDTETGRFLQRDPKGYIDVMNLYEYVKSRPTVWLDPLGLSSSSCHLQAQ